MNTDPSSDLIISLLDRNRSLSKVVNAIDLFPQYLQIPETESKPYQYLVLSQDLHPLLCPQVFLLRGGDTYHR